MSIRTESYSYTDETCPSCNAETQVSTKTIVHEIGRHSNGRREFKDGGHVLGELEVTCNECGHTIWQSDPTLPTADTDDWTPGNACPMCDETFIDEYHVDWKLRTFDGQHISDGDRVATIMYACRGCDSVLDTRSPPE